VDADVLIVGGGVAGLSLAAALGPRRRVLLPEAQDICGRRASGRSVSFSHFGIRRSHRAGADRAQRRLLRSPSRRLQRGSARWPRACLVHRHHEMLPALARLRSAMIQFAPRPSPRKLLRPKAFARMTSRLSD
jgi:glycine/D-amino acid oxidase-like deaminating enzyme